MLLLLSSCQDFKAAYLLGVSPRDQFWSMLIGSGGSVLVSAAAYVLYTSAWTVPGPELPAPTAQVWLDMAQLVRIMEGGAKNGGSWKMVVGV